MTYVSKDKVDTITINNALDNSVTTGGGADVMSLPPESGSHNEMHNLVCGRISDEKDKGAVYAGIQA